MRADKPGAEALLREVWADLPQAWDEDSDGCRFGCGGNVQLGGARGAIARREITPHAEACIYRRIKEYFDE